MDEKIFQDILKRSNAVFTPAISFLGQGQDVVFGQNLRIFAALVQNECGRMVPTPPPAPIDHSTSFKVIRNDDPAREPGHSHQQAYPPADIEVASAVQTAVELLFQSGTTLAHLEAFATLNAWLQAINANANAKEQSTQGQRPQAEPVRALTTQGAFSSR